MVKSGSVLAMGVAFVLAVSTSGTPDLVVYPDSGKLGACERLPDRAGLFEIFRMADAVDYHDGERPPAPPA